MEGLKVRAKLKRILLLGVPTGLSTQAMYRHHAWTADCQMGFSDALAGEM